MLKLSPLNQGERLYAIVMIAVIPKDAIYDNKTNT